MSNSRSAETPFERRERLNLETAIALSSQISNSNLSPPLLNHESPPFSTSSTPSSNSNLSRPRPPRLSNALILEARERLRLDPSVLCQPTGSLQPTSTPLNHSPIPSLPLPVSAPKPPQSPLLSEFSGQLPPTLLVGPPEALIPQPLAPLDQPVPLSIPVPSDPVSIPHPPSLPPPDAPASSKALSLEPKPAARMRKKKLREPASRPAPGASSEASGSRSGTRVRKRSALGKASDETLVALRRLEQPDDDHHKSKDTVGPEMAKRARGARIQVASSDTDQPTDRPVPPVTPRQAPIVVLSSSPLSSPSAESVAEETPAKVPPKKQPRMSEGSEVVARKDAKTKKKAPLGQKNTNALSGVPPDKAPVVDEAPCAGPVGDSVDAQPADELAKQHHPAKARRGRPRRRVEADAGAEVVGLVLDSPVKELVLGGCEEQELGVQPSACEVDQVVEKAAMDQTSSPGCLVDPARPGGSSGTNEKADCSREGELKSTTKPISKRSTVGLGGKGRPLSEILGLMNTNKAKVGFRVGLRREEKHRLHVKIEPKVKVQKQVLKKKGAGIRKRKRGEYDSGEDSFDETGRRGGGGSSCSGSEVEESDCDCDEKNKNKKNLDQEHVDLEDLNDCEIEEEE